MMKEKFNNNINKIASKLAKDGIVIFDDWLNALTDQELKVHNATVSRILQKSTKMLPFSVDEYNLAQVGLGIYMIENEIEDYLEIDVGLIDKIIDSFLFAIFYYSMVRSGIMEYTGLIKLTNIEKLKINPTKKGEKLNENMQLIKKFQDKINSNSLFKTIRKFKRKLWTELY